MRLDDSFGAIVMATARRDAALTKEQVDELVRLTRGIATREEYERVIDEYCSNVVIARFVIDDSYGLVLMAAAERGFALNDLQIRELQVLTHGAPDRGEFDKILQEYLERLAP